MALFQPTNIIPSTFSGPGAGTVDITQDVSVSWQVNGSSPMIAYQVDIMQNDTASTPVFTTGKVTLSEPFYGVNYQGNSQQFSTLIASAGLIAAGMYNGYALGYKLAITQWWSDTDSITQSSASYFITRDTPQLTLEEFPNPILSRIYTFKADYFQAQGDAIEWVRWEILAGGENQEALLDTGKIYGTSELQVDYDGFFPGSNYLIRCTVQTVNGVAATTGWIAFSAQYGDAQFEGQVTACALCNTDAVQVAFPPGLYIMGEASGEYTIADGKMDLPSGSSVAWNNANGNPLSLAAPFSIAWAGTIAGIGSTPATLFEIGMTGGTMAVKASAAGITGTLGTSQIFQYTGALASGNYIAIAIMPEQCQIMVASTKGATLPSATLYPSTTLYPSNGQLSGLTNTIPVNAWQSSISSITVYGPQTTDYVWIVSEQFSQSALNGMTDINGYSPEFTENTQFLADFSSGLSAGSLTASEEVTGISVYRQKIGEPYFSHIADFPIGTQAIRDYAACSQQSYQYYIYAATENAYSATSLVSPTVTPLFWNYTVLECTKDINGVYHVQNEYRFALDVTSGVVGNNNEPTVYKNFTRYPTRQPINSNYKSGTLTAYIGKAVNGRYVETKDLSEDLYALSTSSMTKFLKNRKGELLMIETAAPISMQIGDKYKEQPAKISLPWVEVGTTKGAAIVTDEDDTYWTLGQ